MQAPAGRTHRLRAHHLLCIFGFRGLGYSESFVSNMQAVVDLLFSAGGAAVEVCHGCDDICAACPRAADGECTAGDGSGRTVMARDRRVLQAVGLKVGTRMSSGALARLVAGRIDGSTLERICAGCQWLAAGYCREGLERFRKGGRAPAG